MALLSSELASVHAMCCIRCGATIVLERPAEPAHRVCGAPGATAACQFVRLCSADRLDDASAQQLLYAIRGAKTLGTCHVDVLPCCARVPYPSVQYFTLP